MYNINNMASTSNSTLSHSNRKNLIEQFCSVTGAKKEEAVKMLDVCNWNLEMAVNMHVDSDLQEEGNVDVESVKTSAKNSDDDTVRAPIPPSRGVLVEEGYNHVGWRDRKRRTRSVFDGFRDFQAESQWQESELGANSMRNEAYKRRKTLEDLFRPPLDLIYRGSFEAAREAGQSSNKWLMINIQDSQEFACQVLNRDVWSNSAVKSLVSEHFVFWQVYCDSAEGQRYMQFYKPVDFPYIAILDPRTGENLVVWNTVDAAGFCELVTTFLSHHTTIDNSSNGAKKNAKHSILDDSEEQQLKAAVAASLNEATNIIDDDEDDSEIETFDSDSESQHSKLPSNSELSESSYVNDQDNGDQESWTSYLGPKEDETTKLILRLPDGKREQVVWPCSTKVKALILFSESLGYEQVKYELVTNFPRKYLCTLPYDKTLKEVGLYPQEMIFVQLRNSSQSCA